MFQSQSPFQVGCQYEGGPDAGDPERPLPPVNWQDQLREMEVQAALATAAMDNLRREYEAVLKREAKEAERDPADQLRSIRRAARRTAQFFQRGVRKYKFYKKIPSAYVQFPSQHIFIILILKVQGINYIYFQQARTSPAPVGSVGPLRAEEEEVGDVAELSVSPRRLITPLSPRRLGPSLVRTYYVSYSLNLHVRS